MKIANFLLFTFLYFSIITAQTSSTDRLVGYKLRKQLKEQSIAANIPFRSVGPSIMSGRVVDIDVNPENTNEFYVAYASGGLWKTENNGTSFTPIFDNEMVMTIGDIAVDWNNRVIWVGTGENNSSRSSYSGCGIFKSGDDGKTWEFSGLPESQHIGRIIIDEQNPNIINVAVLGHLYTQNNERGFYRTTDGGKTWTQTLFVNELTGGIDIICDPLNNNVLYAASWQRDRKAWNFVGNGIGSGLWKSNDKGASWAKISGANSGFPEHQFVGRIGLAVSLQNGKSIVYAIFDNQTLKNKSKETNSSVLTKDTFRNISKSDFIKIPLEKLSEFLEDNDFPKKYTAEKIIELVKNDDLKPIALVEFLEDANVRLLESDVIGPEIYKSENGGISWEKTHKKLIDDFFSTYGYYFGQIRVAVNDPNILYILGVPILKSNDGGATFKNINGDNVHGDHHALWLNPKNPNHIINGNDGGVNISYDGGEHWTKCNTPPVGQFYNIAVDNDEPYNIYGGLQDNGVWVGPSNYKATVGWQDEGKYPYQFLLGGDGMQVQVDPRDNNIVYAGFQFGHYYRINRQKNETTDIQPKHDLGERPLRFNWQSPIHLSVHQPDVIYLGSNKLHRSMNRGEKWDLSTSDLTNGGAVGNISFGTLTTIHESPLRFGLIYTGSDDGMVQVSKDGGYNWENISTGLPDKLWVSRVQASQHKIGRVYVSLNGYRNDDFNSYLYVSEDFGKNWKKIGSDLPLEPINVVKESISNEHLIFIGTDHGIYGSLDNGISFFTVGKGIPAVPVHDIVLHPKNSDLIVGTHGRSIYIGNIKYLEDITPEVSNNELFVYKISKIKYNGNWGNKRNEWTDYRIPETNFPIYSKNGGDLSIKIKTDNDIVLKSIVSKIKYGIQFISYDLSVDNQCINLYEKYLNEKNKNSDNKKLVKSDNEKYYIRKGKYKLEFQLNNKIINKEFIVE